MNVHGFVFVVIVCIIGSILVVRALSQQLISPKFALVWFASFFGLILINGSSKILFFISYVIGLDNPDKVARPLGMLFLAALIFSLSMEMGKINRRVEHIVRKIALMENIHKEVHQELSHEIEKM